MRLYLSALILASLPTSAAVITYELTGRVDTVRGVSGVSVGDAVLATFNYDNAAPLNDPPEAFFQGEYQGGAGSLKVKIGATEWSAPIRIMGLQRTDVCIGGIFTGGPCEGIYVSSTSSVTESGPAAFGATFIFFGAVADGNTVLTGPTPYPLPADVRSFFQALEGQIAQGGDFIYYKLDPPAGVPEPATVISAGLGVLGLLAVARRRAR